MGLDVTATVLVGWYIPKHIVSKYLGCDEGDIGYFIKNIQVPNNWEIYVSYSQSSEYAECNQSYYLCMRNKYFSCDKRYDLYSFVTAMKNIENCDTTELEAIHLAREIGITEEMSIIMVTGKMW